LQPVTITLNQREVSGRSGMTVLEIAREAGVYIPTICDDPCLEPVGACRLCLVENENTGALLASCVTAATPGMVINTHSSRVQEHRKNIVSLMLASHPDACLVCDKGNRCRLHQVAAEMGIGEPGLEKISRHAAVEELNPFIVRDTAKCILCGKCIRACREIVVEGALDYYYRGFAARPATFNDSPLEHSECTFCGLCLSLCPTGALMESENPYRGTTSEAVQSTCSFCGCGCSVSLEIKDRQVVRVLPAPGQLALCVRGSFGYEYIHSRDRLTRPLVKKNGTFEEVSWTEALAAAGEGLQRAGEKHGPGALAVFGSSRCTNEENYLLQRFARTVLGTGHVDNGSSLYNLAIRRSLGETTGFFTTSNFLETLENADLILVAGTDPTVTAPQVGYAIKRAVHNRKAKMILIEPRRTRLAFFAHQWLRPLPESDLLLLNSMGRAVIEEGLLNREYVSRQTEGFEDLSDFLREFPPEKMQEAVGIPAEEIRSAARLYAGSTRSVIVFGSGVTDTINGTGNIMALANLALLTGNVWGSGCGIYPIQKANNAQGACEMGSLPDALPGYQPVEQEETRKKFEDLWERKIPAERGLSAMEAFNSGREIPWKAVYMVGENPVACLPRPQLTEEALSSLDFLVVQDLFLTKTAQFADVVLPASSFAEKEGSFTSFEGKIGWLQRAIPPLEGSLPDWEIVLQLAKEMGDPLPYSSLSQVMKEIEEFVPLYESYYRPDDYFARELEKEWSYWEERHHRVFQSMDGFSRFSPPRPRTPYFQKDGEYPYYLILEAPLAYFGSGTRSGKSRRLRSFYPREVLKISADDAAELSLNSGERVKVVSPFARLETVVEISEALPAGTLSLPISFPGVLDLFRITRDDRRSPSLEPFYVKLERVNLDE